MYFFVVWKEERQREKEEFERNNTYVGSPLWMKTVRKLIEI